LNQQSDKPTDDAGSEGIQLFDEANSEYDAGNYVSALELFDRVIEQGLISEVVLNNKGAALDAMGRHSEASECYRKATSISYSYELAWHNLGNSLYSQDLFEKAASAYSKAASLKPGRKENWSGLAASYSKMERFKKAKIAIDKLSKFAKEDDSLLLLQADMYTDAGYLDLAIKCSESYILLHPDSAEGFSQRGNAEHEAGDFDKAIDSYEKALALAQEDKEIWNNLGYTCFVARQFQKALECFDKAIAIDPLYKPAWYNKGYAYHGADLLEEAVECYNKAIAIDSKDRVLWNNLGNALYNLGKYAESIPKFVEAIEVDPDYEIAWNNIGNALEKMGEYSEAIPYHDRSLEIAPDFDYALYAKGVCKSMTGDLESGYDLILESLELNPTYEEAWKARSRVAGQMGRIDDALLSIDEALSLNPEFDQGWVERGEILLKAGNPEGSQASFEMALRCLGSARTDTVGGLSTILRRGDVLLRMGRFEEALANIESVVLTKKLGHLSIPKALELRKFLHRTDLPAAVKEAIESCADTQAKKAYVRFLLDLGDWQTAEKVVSWIDTSSNDGSEIEFFNARISALRGDIDKAVELIGSTHEALSQAMEQFDGETREAKGDFEGAARAYKDALSLKPNDASVATALARVHLKRKDLRSALNAADVAIGIDPREWEPYRVKSEAYAAMGDKEKADEELAKSNSRLANAGMRHEEFPAGVVK
jgi:tetratricopeptide (TPR) repeat protein